MLFLSHRVEEEPEEPWTWLRHNLRKYLKVHTLCWFGTSDVFLYWKAMLGITAAVAFTLGFVPPLAMLVSNLAYLSWIIIGKEFFRLQFDSLVVECMLVIQFSLQTFICCDFLVKFDPFFPPSFLLLNCNIPSFSFLI
jgi:hypothetical protein